MISRYLGFGFRLQLVDKPKIIIIQFGMLQVKNKQYLTVNCISNCLCFIEKIYILLFLGTCSLLLFSIIFPPSMDCCLLVIMFRKKNVLAIPGTLYDTHLAYELLISNIRYCIISVRHVRHSPYPLSVDVQEKYIFIYDLPKHYPWNSKASLNHP